MQRREDPARTPGQKCEVGTSELPCQSDRRRRMGAGGWSDSGQEWWSAWLRRKACATWRCAGLYSFEPQHADHLPRRQGWRRSQQRHWRWVHLTAYCAIVLTALRRGGPLSGITLVSSVADGDATKRICRHGQRCSWHHGDGKHLAAGCQPHHSKADGRAHRSTAVAVRHSTGKRSASSCTPALAVHLASKRLLISRYWR